MEKVLFLIPKGIKEGQPSYERLIAFKRFYENKGFSVESYEVPNLLSEKVRLLYLVYKRKYKYVFISMPPFSNWWLFLLPFVDITLDIRDGWSIAIKSGYGGLFKPNKKKAKLAMYIECFFSRLAEKKITCTPGLATYLNSITKGEFIYIPNGVSEKDYRKVKLLKQEYIHNRETPLNKCFTLSCAGQFSEYGVEKVKTVLSQLEEKASLLETEVKIKLIGSSAEYNSWIFGWLIDKNYSSVTVELLPRMNKFDMYKEILNSDMCLTIIRDPSYDFGTKIFDYILCGKYIYNYFSTDNNFTNEFQAYMKSDLDISCNDYPEFPKQYIREEAIKLKSNKLVY